MPNIKAKEKDMRKSRERRERNRSVKTGVKTHVKRFYEALDSGDAELAGELYREAARSIDKAVSKGALHKNKGANMKSRMSRSLNREA